MRGRAGTGGAGQGRAGNRWGRAGRGGAGTGWFGRGGAGTGGDGLGEAGRGRARTGVGWGGLLQHLQCRRESLSLGFGEVRIILKGDKAMCASSCSSVLTVVKHPS